jgi:hypothetical protein
MLDNYIIEAREELNYLVGKENAELHQGEILTLSQKLDRLIALKQAILIRRTRSNYCKQLQSFLCPTLYAKVVAF